MLGSWRFYGVSIYIYISRFISLNCQYCSFGFIFKNKLFISIKKIKSDPPKLSAINENEQNIMEPFENTIDVDEDELT